jgi:hypothetical protein
VVNPHGEKLEEIMCPECGGDKLQRWNPVKGKCPKCGGDMKATGVCLCVD